MNGDVYIWNACSLTRIVKNVHSGPVFTMFTTVKDGLIVTGGKEKGFVPTTSQFIERFYSRTSSSTIFSKIFEFNCFIFQF